MFIDNSGEVYIACNNLYRRDFKGSLESFTLFRRSMKSIIISCILFLSAFSLMAQEQKLSDTIQTDRNKETPIYLEPYHRNVIKFNPTPMLALDLRNVTFAYERLLKNNQSMAFQAGYLVFNLAEDTLAGLIKITDRSRFGVNLAVDYRYYPFQRNKRPAPDGLYVGGYAQYYGLRAENKFDILPLEIDEEGKIISSMNFTNLGVEIGYQFVFWERMTLDFILFGPSMSLFSGNLTIEGDLSQEQIENIDEELVNKLVDRFPFMAMIYSPDNLKFTGDKTSFGTGFRYSIQIGFHF
jgi:hypothetical protein